MADIKKEDWGLIEYAAAYTKQKTLFDRALTQKVAGHSIQNTLVLCEHPHVITLGKHAKNSNQLFPDEYLSEIGVECFHTDRGGDITYHGQGQLVGYPIFDIESFHIGLKEYVFNLEEAIIILLDSYSIRGNHLAGASGVWLDTDKPAFTRKICAIGVKSNRFVTMHGFALNVNTKLEYFNLINPCGFTDKGVTSMEKELGKKINMEEVKTRLTKIIKSLFL
jgi:lipoyl(octanoyl) transferase